MSNSNASHVVPQMTNRRLFIMLAIAILPVLRMLSLSVAATSQILSSSEADAPDPTTLLRLSNNNNNNNNNATHIFDKRIPQQQQQQQPVSESAPAAAATVSIISTNSSYIGNKRGQKSKGPASVPFYGTTHSTRTTPNATHTNLGKHPNNVSLLLILSEGTDALSPPSSSHVAPPNSTTTTTTTTKEEEGSESETAKRNVTSNETTEEGRLSLDQEYKLLKQRDDALLSEHFQGGESFSACILIKDENHRLSEWIAYHYFALPLRHLVVLPDPSSTQSPEPILDMWRPLMNITLWSDTTMDFHADKYRDDSISAHRERQKLFYKKCSHYLKDDNHNRTWTSFFDVDEYLRINPNLSPSRLASINATELSKQVGYVLKLVTATAAPTADNNNDDYDDSTTRMMIQDETAFKNRNATCLSIPRKAFGAKESPRRKVFKHVPDYINATNLETLRFRFRARLSEYSVNGAPKSLFNIQYAPPIDRDIEKIDDNENTNATDSTTTVTSSSIGNNASIISKDTVVDLGDWAGPHWVVKPACLKRNHKWHYDYLIIQHYRGSLETYLSRTDDRRKAEAFQRYQEIANKQLDGSIRSWILTFIDYVGVPLAKHFLKDAGRMDW